MRILAAHINHSDKYCHQIVFPDIFYFHNSEPLGCELHKIYTEYFVHESAATIDDSSLSSQLHRQQKIFLRDKITQINDLIFNALFIFLFPRKCVFTSCLK